MYLIQPQVFTYHCEYDGQEDVPESLEKEEEVKEVAVLKIERSEFHDVVIMFVFCACANSTYEKS